MTPGSSCYVPYENVANPVYLQQWVYVNTTDGANAIELGAGHQCNNFTDYFYGYRYLGAWFSLGTLEVQPSSAGHYFDIHRLANVWHLVIDGAERASVTWAAPGLLVLTGAGSSDTAAYVPNHWFSQLQLTFNEGPWYFWTSTQYSQVDTPSMCGHYNGATQWSAGENTICS